MAQPTSATETNNGPHLGVSTRFITSQAGKENLAFIDALRGLAALYVVICHVGFIPTPPLTLPELETHFVYGGHTGVILFFLVSSFTLSLSSERRQHESNHLVRFYFRRLFIILPLFYASVLLACLRDYILHGFIHEPSAIFSSLIGVFQPGKIDGMVWASWTLGIELTFYLVFPFIFALAHNLKRALVILGATIAIDLVISNFILASLSADVHDSSIRFSFLHNLPFFLFGIVFYFLYRKTIASNGGGRPIGYLLTYTALILFAVLIVWKPESYTSLARGGHYLVTATMVLFMLGLVYHPTSFIVNPATRFLGKISYSLYLLHPPLVFFLIPTFRTIYAKDMSTNLAFFLSLSLTLAILVPISTLSYSIIEVPGLKLGSRLIKRYL